jgi:hypothetical protein
MSATTGRRKQAKDIMTVLIALAKHPCQAWRSSLAAGLSHVISADPKTRGNSWQKLTCVDVGQDTALGDGDVTEQLVQLLIISDGELEMTWDDTCLLVVTRGITSQLEDFGSEVLENGS